MRLVLEKPVFKFRFRTECDEGHNGERREDFCNIVDFFATQLTEHDKFWPDKDNEGDDSKVVVSYPYGNTAKITTVDSLPKEVGRFIDQILDIVSYGELMEVKIRNGEDCQLEIAVEELSTGQMFYFRQMELEEDV